MHIYGYVYIYDSHMYTKSYVTSTYMCIKIWAERMLRDGKNESSPKFLRRHLWKYKYMDIFIYAYAFMYMYVCM